MSDVTDAIRQHHQVLITKLDAASDALAANVTEETIDGLLSLLTDDLLPHAQGEERSFYPLVDPLIAAHARPTATMSIDHEYIEGGVRTLEGLAASVCAGAGAERHAAEADLQRALHELAALVRLHVEKEERGYLPRVEAYLTAEEQQALLDEMHSE